MKTYEGVRGSGGVRVVVKEDGITIATTAPFPTWQAAQVWEWEQEGTLCNDCQTNVPETIWMDGDVKIPVCFGCAYGRAGWEP